MSKNNFSGKKLYEIHHIKYLKETFGKILLDFDNDTCIIYPKQNYPKGTHPDFYFSSWAESKNKIIEGEEANSWLSHHVCPPQRPNIKDILDAKGLSHYSKTGIFASNEGRSDWDDYCIEYLKDIN